MNYAWIKSYLSKLLQYIHVDENCRTEYCVVKCGLPQSSILGPLLFLLYVNDLKNASSVLDPIIFANDISLFYTHSNIKKLFSTMSEELANINQWFTSNKLSLDAKKRNIPVSINPVKKMKSLLLCYQSWLSIIMLLRGRNLFKFLKVFLDENLNWKKHIKYTENKKLRTPL